MRLYLFVFLLLPSCHWFSPFSQTKEQLTEPKEECVLDKKSYSVQSASYDKSEELYSLTLLGTPFCFKNPLLLENVRLGRLDEKDSKEKASLDYIDAEHSTLYIIPDFQIKITAKEINEKGVASESSSMWTPLIAGVAGAAIGGLIANKLSNRPQYVTPPSPSRKSQGSSILRGFDEKQVSDTPPKRKLTSKKISQLKKTSLKEKRKKPLFSKSKKKKRKSGSSFFKSKRRRRR